MTWTDFYLVCFLVGFGLSLLTFLLGSFDLHLPHLHWHGGLDVHFHGGALHAGAGHAAHPLSPSQPELSWFNFGTLTAFLAWFGGAGYLLSRYSGFWFWPVLGLAVVAGIVGGSIVFWFVVKVLMKHDQALDPIDYDMIGVLGTVTVSIREGGTGEIVFSQEGVRRCSGARSEDGTAIVRQTEVVVTRYEKGIAYVRRWEDLAEEERSSAQAGTE